MPVGIADEQPARLAPDFAEALAALAHGGCIDDRQQLLGVVRNQRVEQRLIVVLQVAHVAVLAKRRVARIEHALAPQALILKRADMGREQPVQSERIALVLSECSALVQPRVGE